MSLDRNGTRRRIFTRRRRHSGARLALVGVFVVGVVIVLALAGNPPLDGLDVLAF